MRMKNSPKFTIERRDNSTIQLLDVAYDHLDFVLKNPEYFKTKDHFSTVQYSNVTLLSQLDDVCKKIYNSLARTRRDSTYLNIGTGPGILEFYANEFKAANIDSVEWDQQERNFSVIRKALNVEPTYLCNDVRDNNFDIYNCNKKYDYVLLIRFFPINAENATVSQLKDRLSKFKKYANKAIIIDNIDVAFNKKLYDVLASLEIGNLIETNPSFQNASMILDLNKI